MSGWSLYLVYFIVPLVIGLAVQGWMKSTFARNSQVPVRHGMTGAEVARRILDSNGLGGVAVQPATGGALSDNFDPRRNAVFLSQPVYAGRSVAATAVAAHETGHAIQHAKNYMPMKARSALFPVASLGSRMWFVLLLMGVIFQFTGLITLALIVFGFAVLFQLVTLPVEFNASRRAAAQLKALGLVTDGEAVGVRKTLTAAAMTYVAAALVSIAQLLYFLGAFRN